MPTASPMIPRRIRAYTRPARLPPTLEPLRGSRKRVSEPNIAAHWLAIKNLLIGMLGSRPVMISVSNRPSSGPSVKPPLRETRQ